MPPLSRIHCRLSSRSASRSRLGPGYCCRGLGCISASALTTPARSQPLQFCKGDGWDGSERFVETLGRRLQKGQVFCARFLKISFVRNWPAKRDRASQVRYRALRSFSAPACDRRNLAELTKAGRAIGSNDQSVGRQSAQFGYRTWDCGNRATAPVGRLCVAASLRLRRQKSLDKFQITI